MAGPESHRRIPSEQARSLCLTRFQRRDCAKLLSSRSCQWYPNPRVAQGTINALPSLLYEGGAGTTILLSVEDITEQRILEREKGELLRRKDVLLEEMQHRIANSLQVISSVILMKARTVKSDEARLHLRETHKRVIAKPLDARIAVRFPSCGRLANLTPPRRKPSWPQFPDRRVMG